MPIINSSKTDPNKILPIRYPWAREYYKAAIANNWTPEEVSMQKDVEQSTAHAHPVASVARPACT